MHSSWLIRQIWVVFLFDEWWIKFVPNLNLPHLHRRRQITNTTIPSSCIYHIPKSIHLHHSTMPGSIQVSVLSFKELPSSSNSVKLSLSKVEHEFGENETFSFPLTNLRDNLMITVHDSEGNQVSQSGIRTMPIIEKGTWDDVFPVEGGGLIHMKLQFFLSEEDRNRIRSMRESAVKKKQAEILGSRHEVSVKAVDTVPWASESCDGPKEQSLQGQSFTVKNVTVKREETSFPHMTQENEGDLKEAIPNDVKETNEESTSNKDNAISLRQTVVPEKLLEDTKTRDFVDKRILEDKNANFVKKISKESNFLPLSKEPEVSPVNNTSQSQEIDLLKRLQDSSSSDVGSSRLTVAEKIKSFSPKLAGEMDRQGSLEKTPQNIKKMISVFESTISQDSVPLKSASTKSYRYGTSRLLKDYYEKSESGLKNSEKSSSSRLRNSFSTGDLRKNISNIITKGDQDEFDSNFVEPTEDTLSKGNDPKGAEQMGTKALYNEENLSKSRHEGANNGKESIDGRKTSKNQWTFEKRQFCMTTQINLSSDCKIEEKGHQEKNVASTSEVVKGEEESPENADAEASTGSFGQAMKIALVVGFGVIVFFFRQRESGKGKNKENIRASRNQSFMNKRGSTEERGRRVGVSRSS
ncbi:hypothetical protein QVD17_29596 [Tagetes erecta]|uniref:Uncharacterized protein n=1 Tax=Tagetes erecta TaxID=13708 RepID=A0AAD8K699_TARER|nr:hypothetical protein QVD17_29596 [Tagetes erecta]